MKIKTADLIGPPLDWAVAVCLGGANFRFDTVATYWIDLNGEDRALSKGRAQSFCPSTSGDTVIDLMEKEKIDVEFRKQSFGDGIPHWYASHLKNEGGLIRYHGRGPTLRIAVCRCFVVSKLGDEVDVPEELMT